MATKVTILGESVADRPKEKIEFVHCISGGGELRKPAVSPAEWDEIVLLSRNYDDTGFDLMYAFSKDGGFAYLGYFNDGVV